MKEALGKMEYFGHSKHEDQERTRQARAKLRTSGATPEEVRCVDYTKGHIYSYGTMRTYQNEIKRYADYLEAQGLRKCSMQEAALHTQQYLDYQVDRGLSAYSVHTTASALAKTFGQSLYDYNLPRRRLCDITRSRGARQHDVINQQKVGDVLEANRTLALRRNELKNLRTSNFVDTGQSITMTVRGKGGKINTTVFHSPQELAIIRDLLANKEAGEHVFDRDCFKADADFHHSRAEGLQHRYASVLADIEQRSEARAEYQAEIRAAFAARGKPLRENLDKPYVLRGRHREYCQTHGIPISYDRTAALFVSLSSHYRSDVLIQHYLAK